MVGLNQNKHAGSLSNAKRNVQIQVKMGLLGAYSLLADFYVKADNSNQHHKQINSLLVV